jgi:hypothetical protein
VSRRGGGIIERRRGRGSGSAGLELTRSMEEGSALQSVLLSPNQLVLTPPHVLRLCRTSWVLA